MKIHIFAASAVMAMTLAAGARAGEPTGVAACDDFFAKYEACIKDKAPAVIAASVAAQLLLARSAAPALAEAAPEWELAPAQ